MSIKRPCNRSGCPNLVKKGYCPDHKPRRHKTEQQKFYNKRRWRGSANRMGLRKQQLRRSPLCEIEEKCVSPTVATEVHHKDGNVRNNKDENLISTCKACHTWWEGQYGALR